MSLNVVRVKSVTLEIISQLSKCEKYSDLPLIQLLKNCIHNPTRWAMFRVMDGQTAVGAGIGYVNRPDFVLWMFSCENFFDIVNFSEDEPGFFKFIKSLGCSKIVCFGRPGWIKRRPKGWKIEQVKFSRELS